MGTAAPPHMHSRERCGMLQHSVHPAAMHHHQQPRAPWPCALHDTCAHARAISGVARGHALARGKKRGPGRRTELRQKEEGEGREKAVCAVPALTCG